MGLGGIIPEPDQNGLERDVVVVDGDLATAPTAGVSAATTTGTTTAGPGAGVVAAAVAASAEDAKPANGQTRHLLSGTPCIFTTSRRVHSEIHKTMEALSIQRLFLDEDFRATLL